jgi:hypothetical protein
MLFIEEYNRTEGGGVKIITLVCNVSIFSSLIYPNVDLVNHWDQDLKTLVNFVENRGTTLTLTLAHIPSPGIHSHYN